MPNYANGVNVICPFYIRETDVRIFCECKESVIISFKFASAADKKAYQIDRCCKHDYTARCPLAEALEKAWSG